MLKLADLPLRRKQTLIIMLTSTVALILACAGFALYDVSRFKREMVDSVSSTARVLENNLTAALEFKQPAPAIQTLSALSGDRNIVVARVYTEDGELFVTYLQEGAQFPSLRSRSLEARHEFSETHLYLFHPIRLSGESLGTIELVADLSGLRRRLWRYAGIAGLVLAASLLVAFALSNWLQNLISNPILHLAGIARSVAVRKDYSVRATKQNDDELGDLVDGFNEMLAQIQKRDTALQDAGNELEKRVEERTRELKTIHTQLVDASRRSGMAEIATNVLHNIGNVLNSVNISTDVVVQTVKRSRAPSLGRVVGLLQEHAADLGMYLSTDPRGKQLPGYLAQLSEHLLAEQSAIIAELDSLRRNIEHIKDIVAMQQSYATFGGVKELVDVVQLVEDSLRMDETSFSRHGVEIIREFEPVPPINVEKHKVLQILVNLVRNARLACLDSDRLDKRLTLRVANSNGSIKIAVMDNGVGIPTEDLTRIFNHGFTTRKGGHGFGLHSSVLAAKELGGSLTVHSGGPGRGAMFTLELPYGTALSGVGQIT